MRFLLCVFLMFVCGVGTVGATPFTCGANATYFSSTQKVSDPEFLYSAKADYDVLATMSFREAQDGSQQLTHGKIYECDPAAFKKSSYCDMYTLVVADAGWVWKGNAVSGQTLFFCDMRDENHNDHDSWLPLKLVDDFAGEKTNLRKVNVYNKSGVTCWVSVVRREVKCDGLASKSSSTVTETKKSCDGKAHGTSESGVNCPAGFTNASKCSRQCNDGTWNYTLTDCVAGFKPSGNKCVARTGEDCPSNEWPQYAAGGKYNSNGKCYATACNDKALLVVDDKGKNQGWCVAKTYCQTEKKKGAKCKLKVIDGTKTDKTCECPQEEQATDKIKAAPENASQLSECGEKDISADDRKKQHIVKSKVDNSEEYVHKGSDGKAICKTFKCSNGFIAENDTCVADPAVANLPICNSEQQKLITDESVKKRIVKSSIDGETEPYSVKQSDKPVCVVNVCKTGMIADKSTTKCVKDEFANNNQNTGEQPQGDSDAAPQGQNPQSQSADNNTPADGADCADKDLPAHATAGQYVNGQCRITKCQDGYVLRSEKDSSGVEKPVCMSGEEESQKKIDELRDNAQKMKDKEQSTANKLLGAAGIGATGIGGMMLASGMAEQNADAEAETAMKAYLATFHCNYGGGKNIPGGTNDVELPGGNELIGLYTEYVALANDLKARKVDLGMQPGIESEAILESATSGLYDDVAVGKTGGAYASLARALMDPEGEDAKLWAAQKEESAKNVKTGAITAGVGAGGSLVGNMIVNRDKNKDE